MYGSLSRRSFRDPSDDRDGLTRRTEAHRGTSRDFLLRHEREVGLVASASREERTAFARCLFGRVTDVRNLGLAIDHLRACGGDAPGPNGRRPSGIGDAERWSLARALGDSIRGGSYHPGPSRKVKIPKGGDAGYRALKIQDVEDRAVQRAILQVIQPFLDPRFLDTSLGSRPGKGRVHALARAETLADEQGRWVAVAADAKDAFDRIPKSRLMELSRKALPSADLVALIGLFVEPGGNKGIAQGGPLSPLRYCRISWMEMK